MDLRLYLLHSLLQIPGIYPVDRYYLKSIHVSMTSPFSVPAQLGMFYIKFIKQPVLWKVFSISIYTILIVWNSPSPWTIKWYNFYTMTILLWFYFSKKYSQSYSIYCVEVFAEFIVIKFLRLLTMVSGSILWGIHASQTTQIRIVRVINHPHFNNNRIKYLREKSGVPLVLQQRSL